MVGARGNEGAAARRGLVLAGGALRGAFQAGVVSALARAGVSFDVIAGTSVGAVNGAALLLGYGPRLPEMWLENLRVVRWFDARRLLRGRTPFLISEAMRFLVARYADIRRLREHPTEMLVSVTEWDTGRNVLFSNRDPGGWTDDEQVLQFLASLTIPGICAERIVIRGRRYCDGGFSCNLPIEAVLARGCREVIVVETNAVRAPAPLARFIQPLARTLEALPFPEARLVAGLAREFTLRLPRERDGAVIRLVAPRRDLRINAFDFHGQRGIREGLDAGLAAGEEVARELLAADRAAAAGGAA